MERVPYDELALFAENAAEVGLPYDGPPAVRRTRIPVDGERALSALVWGEAPPELVLLHGGAQNAHTWDTVALALRRPLVAIDLPGHGQSDGPATPDAGYDADVAVAIRAAAPSARAVVGMSAGGITALGIVARVAPQLNVFAIGFPITIASGLVLLTLGLPLMAQPFSRVMEAILKAIGF